MRSAIWRTSSAWGFSLDTDEDMNPKSSSAPRGAVGGSSTRTPCAPQTTASPACTSLTGTVWTTVCPSSSVTTSPQSISGRRTRSHSLSSRTRVSRFVVE
jgi:hypothetical protein